MIELTKRMDIIERLGPLGNMVADMGSRLNYPITTPPELAKQFSENETLEVGMESVRLSEVCLQIPPDLFPVKSFDDLINKLEKNELRRINPIDIKKFLGQNLTVGYTLKSNRKLETLRREGNHFKNKTGGPDAPPELNSEQLNNPPEIKPVNSKRSDVTDKLGPLGGMVLDLTDEVVFPLKDKLALARQFSDDEHILLGTTQYPIPELVLRLPEEFFPILSQEELTEKLVKINFREINPYNLRGLLEQSDSIGLLLEMDQKQLMNKTANRMMVTGGPDDIPEIKDDPQIEEALPIRGDTGNKLGIMGDLIYDLSERIQYPVMNAGELAANFKEKDALLLGPQQYPLSKLALRVPEELFPLKSYDEMVEKLSKSGIQEVGFSQLKNFIDSDTTVGYHINYKDEEIKDFLRGADMKMGGPETPPPEYNG